MKKFNEMSKEELDKYWEDEEDNTYGVVAEAATQPDFDADSLEEFELVKVLVLGIDSYVSKEEKKVIETENKTRKDKADALGLPFEPVKITYKERGVTVRYCIIARGRDKNEPVYPVVNVIGDEVHHPNYVCFGQITQWPPALQFKNAYGEDKVGTSQCKDGLPVLGFVPADPQPTSMFVDNKPLSVKDLVGLESEYPELFAKENERKAKWLDAIQNYETLSEEDALEQLLIRVSRKVLACRYNTEKDRFAYYPIMPGMFFWAGIKYARAKDKSGNYVKTKYFNLIAHQWIKGEDKGYRQFYSITENDYGLVWKDMILPTPESLRWIELINIHNETRKAERAGKKQLSESFNYGKSTNGD